MTARVAALAAGSLLAVLAGCGTDDGSDASGGVVRDSAGFTVVEHPALDPERLPTWRLAPEPSFDVGRVSGESAADPYLLHDVRDALRLPDGSVVAIVGLEIRRFGPDGSHRWSQGIEGDGPGAYRAAADLARAPGDSIVVWDYALRRLSFLAPDGALARLLTLDLPAAGQRMERTADSTRWALLASGSEVSTEPNGLRRVTSTQRLLRVDTEGEVVTSTEPRLRMHGYRTEAGYVVEPPWPAVRWLAPTRDGFWRGDPFAPELRRYGDDDRLRAVVRWAAPELEVTDADEAAYRDWAEEELSEASAQARSIYLDALRRVPWPARIPAFDRMALDRRGRIWLREYVREDREEEGEERSWVVLSADGRRLVARFEQPTRFEIHDIGDDWLLGVEQDALDVEHLRIYRVIDP